MGSMITLGIGEMDVDWGKNQYFNDYSKLFIPTDKKDIPYCYADNIIENKLGYSRKMGRIKERLELLGYSIHNLRNMYQKYLSEYFDDSYPDTLDFDELLSVFSTISIKDYTENHDYGFGGALEHILNNKLFESLKKYYSDDLTFDSETFFENFDINFLLRLFMENPQNLELDLEWKTADVIEGG